MKPCDRCGGPGALVAYWGPTLCRPCAHYVAEKLDELDRWPPVPWDDDEVANT